MTSASVPASFGAEGAVISGKYRLESLLGEGGMGSVWRALHLQLDAPVAIKLLHQGVDTGELGERLRVEGRAVAKLVHPSIVRVFDVGESESGEPFIVMELLNGQSLGTLLERGPLTPGRAVQLLLPIAEALSVAHAGGVVHRDLKPDNIFIAQEGAGVQPKLLDFGIAHVMNAPALDSSSSMPGGLLVGSPEYMSPEQVRGHSDIDQRADVWGFCVVLYEAISGRAPFEGDSCQEVLRRVLVEEPTPLHLAAHIDAELSALVHAGLAKNRDERPKSVLELGRRLAAWLLARGVQEDAAGASLETKWLGRTANAPASRPPPRRPRRWAPSGLVASGLLVASGALVGCIAWVFAYQTDFGDSLAADMAAGPSVLVAAPASQATPSQSTFLRTDSRQTLPVEAEIAPTKAQELRRPPHRVGSLPAARVATRRASTELMNPY